MMLRAWALALALVLGLSPAQFTITTTTVSGLGPVAVVAGASNKPVLLNLTGEAGDLANTDYNGLAVRMSAVGWTVASIDLPAHGADQTAAEAALYGAGSRHLGQLRDRMARGANLGVEMADRCRRAIEWLPSVVGHARWYAVGGISRGGAFALECAARVHDVSSASHVAVAVALNPVGDWGLLAHFAGYPGGVPLVPGKPTLIITGRVDPTVQTYPILQLAADVARRMGSANALELVITGRTTHTVDAADLDRAAVWLQAQWQP